MENGRFNCNDSDLILAHILRTEMDRFVIAIRDWK